MIAGIGTHNAQLARAFVCTEESFDAVQRAPTVNEQPTIDRYRIAYRAQFGVWPFGLHYLDLGEPEVTAVWFPLP